MPRQESPRTRALQPMPSHQQPVVPQTTAKMGPFKGRLLRPGEEFDSNNKLVMSPEAPKIKEFRGTPLGPGDEQYVDESPEGITSPAELLSKFSPVLPSIGDVGGASKAVAFGAPLPGAIKFLKERGRKNIEQIREKGLRTLSGNQDIGYRNEFPTPQTMFALEVAQKRWPRLFGHWNDVRNVDSAIQLDSFTRGKMSHGAHIPSETNYKLGHLQIAPNADVITPGHELIHLKDAILDKDFEKKYMDEMTQFGYDSPAFERERKANRFEGRFKQILDEVAKRGGSEMARDRMGRNIRVKPLPPHMKLRDVPIPAEVLPPEPKKTKREHLKDFLGYDPEDL